MTKAQRKQVVLNAWDEYVGELPEGAEHKLPGYARLYGVAVTVRAIEKCADDDALECSEDVLAAVDTLLHYWHDEDLAPRQSGK